MVIKSAWLDGKLYRISMLGTQPHYIELLKKCCNCVVIGIDQTQMVDFQPRTYYDSVGFLRCSTCHKPDRFVSLEFCDQCDNWFLPTHRLSDKERFLGIVCPDCE